MFKHLTKDASEGNMSVVCCQRFITLFEGGHGIRLQPVCRKFTRLEGSFKYDFDDRSDLFPALLSQSPVMCPGWCQIYLFYRSADVKISKELR